MTQEAMTFGSLFAGIGGFDLGLERSGLTCKWQVEIDEFCFSILERHWPTVTRFRDVRDVSQRTLETVDCVCGGFPCQPVSSAGRQQGASDSRWLWAHVTRVVDELRPRFVVLENVCGLFETGLGSLCVTDLAAMGYDAEWGVFPASAFGAPHRRNRVFLVAYPNGYGWPSRDVVSRVFSQVPKPQDSDWRGEKSKLERGSSGGVYRMPDAEYVRVDDGLPTRLDRERIKALGNSIVPAISEYVGKEVLKANASEPRWSNA